MTPLIEERFGGETRFDGATGLAIFATLAFAVAMAFTIAGHPAGPRQNFMTSTTMLLVVCGSLYSFFLYLATNRRYLKRTVYPALATCLQPLQPTSDDLERVLGKLKLLRWKIGKKLKAKNKSWEDRKWT